jgi:hypothetical protein
VFISLCGRKYVYSDKPHTVDELRYSIYETDTSVEISKLKLVAIFSRDTKFLQEQKGGILTICSDPEFF